MKGHSLVSLEMIIPDFSHHRSIDSCYANTERMPFPTSCLRPSLTWHTFTNVTTLLRDFCKTNIWIVISATNSSCNESWTLFVYITRKKTGRCAPKKQNTSWQMHWQPKVGENSKTLAQISSAELTYELFSCGSSPVEMQHMLSISVMWWMHLAQKCKPWETHGCFYRPYNTDFSQTAPFITNHPPSILMVLKKKCINFTVFSHISPYS